MTVKLFEEYLDEGVAILISPDYSRARSLQKESEQSYKILKEIVRKIGVTDSNANYLIKNSYDIIMELIRSKMFKEGYKTQGQGAHQAEVAYLRVLRFKDIDIEFADQLRSFRNGILYYGKTFDAEYAEKVIEFVEKVYEKLN
ncbi:hypothetical protein CL619_03570 [archaeon]|nr:hypothetical protein [archaeon]|tara:strand:- start:788 stop:1216 length:429 start_codon:yes stop_codon:yes gene_type:complete